MKDSQFGFQYSTEDQQPIRPLFTTNVIAGGFSASFPGFLVGLLVQRRLDPAALQDNRVMVRRMGLIALLFSLLAFVFPFDAK